MKLSQLLFAVALTTASAQDICDPAPTVTVYKQEPPPPKVETVTITIKAPDSNLPQQGNQNNGNGAQQGGVVTVTVQQIVTHTATFTVTHTPPPQTIVQTIIQKPVESTALSNNNDIGVIVQTTVIVDQNGNPITVQPDSEPTPKPESNPQSNPQSTYTAVPASDNNNLGTAASTPVFSSSFDFFNHTSTITNSSAPATANPVGTITSLYTSTFGSSTDSAVVSTEKASESLTTFVTSSTNYANSDSDISSFDSNTESVSSISAVSTTSDASFTSVTSGGSSTPSAAGTISFASTTSDVDSSAVSTVISTSVTESILSTSEPVSSSAESTSSFAESTSSAAESSSSDPLSTSTIDDPSSTSSAVESTSSAVESTSSAVESTSSAVESTSSAVESTSSAVESTSSAVESTSSAAESTSSSPSSTSIESSSTISASSSTPSATDPISSDPLDANSQIAIDAVSNHNRLRALHGVPDVKWNRDLAKYAQDYLASAQCNFAHSGGPYGENLAIGYPTTAASIQAWYDEIKDYDFSKNEFSSSTGHFTQVVWKDSTEIGCAEVECGSGWGGPYLVCEYSPRGNIIGYFKENVLPPLSG
ncbi:hypothetical protein DS838_001143 [Geotrichum bryndzae]|nr:hypothetical protein DS838_001143 [Geotrichum bryndzae]